MPLHRLGLRVFTSLFLVGLAPLVIAQTPSAGMMGANGIGQFGIASLPANPLSPVAIDTDVVSVAVGGLHTLYIKTDGSLWAVGSNTEGQLGTGDTADETEPVQIATGVTAIAAGRAHSLFVKTDGSLWAMGDNTDGQLGTGDNTDRATPVQIASGVGTVAAGDDHTLFIKTDATLWTTGRNTHGQLGDGTTISRHTPAQIATAVAKIAGAEFHTLFVKTDATLWACGQAILGQLGMGGTPATQALPVQVATDVTAIAAGEAHSLFLKSNGTLWGMGVTSEGQLLAVSASRLVSPGQLSTGVSAIAAGQMHSLFLKTDGSVWAAGGNLFRQLGSSTGSLVAPPVQIATGATTLAARHGNSAWLAADGTLWGLGDNSTGQLASAATSQPTPITLGEDIAAISNGVTHTLFLKTDGTLWASGDNSYGQLGDGTTNPRATPVQIATGVASASAGSFHTLYVKTDGTLWATGRNDHGQLGNSSTTNRTTPVQIATGVSAASAGGIHSLFLKTDGVLWGMGNNAYRQVSAFNSTFSPISIPTTIASGVTAFAAGGAHTFYVAGGTLYATGNNEWGQLGTGTTFITPPTSQLLVIATGVTAVSSAYDHTLFLKTDGSLWGMGLNNGGELGLGDKVQRLSPTQITSDVTAIAAGGLGFGRGRGAGHSLFAKRDGSLWAMGDNRFGQLGDGTRVNRLVPVQVPGVAHVVAVAASDLTGAFTQATPVAPSITTQPASQEIEYGAYAHLQVEAAGGFLAYQWFRGASGDTSQPVGGATTAHLITLPLTQTASFWVRVTNSAGMIDSAAVTITPRARLDAILSGVGSLGYGAFGESLGSTRVAVPVPLTADIAALAHSSGHTLILKTDGTLWGVGNNSGGQLGTGDTTPRATPVQIAAGVAAASAGSAHSLFLKTDGTLWSMGSNSSGQIGDGSTTNRTSPFQLAASVQAIAAGSSHSLFLKTDGTLWGTGENFDGQLGDGGATDRTTPIQIATAVTALSAGSWHSLFLKADGTLWAMGSNSSGQLGDGTTAKRSTPVLVASGVSAISAHARGNHSLFLKTDGTLFGMGENASGQLGLGDTADRTTPARIDTGVTAISAGADHSLWIKTDRSLWGAGDNDFGQLGLGSAPDQLLPREIAAGVTHATATAYSSWFVATDGILRGMGRNHAGQLTAANAPVTTPVVLADSVASLDVALSGNWPESRSLALDGQVWSSLGQPADGLALPGNAATEAMRLIPMPIFKQAGQAVEYASGPERLLFLRADGTLWGSGDNTTGALGTGDTLSRAEPVLIATGVSDAASTGFGTTFLKSDGTLWTTGQARSGSGGGQHSFGLSPVQIDTGVVALASSFLHVLYLKSDGGLWGFGDGGYRQLGVSTSSPNNVISTPVLIATNVARFAAGQRHTLLVKTNGSLWACGFSSFGQLGNTGVTGGGLGIAPTQIGIGAADVVTTAETSFMLRTDGTVWATGQNTFGQLGVIGGNRSTFGQVLIALPPRSLQPFTGVARIIPALSGENTFFLKTDGSLWGTGRNDLGQLGLGHVTNIYRPEQIRAQAHAVSASGLHTLFLHDPVGVAAPAIVAHPAPQTVAFGDFATLSITASGTELLRYQWYQGASGDTSLPVAGATDATLRLPAFAGTASYWVRVTNLAGSADSTAATITIAGAGSPTFRAWAEAAGLRGSRLAISADADGDGLANLLEYAFRTAPDSSGDHAAPTPEHIRTAEGEFLVLTHRRRKDAPPAFAYEASANLLTWENQTLTPIVLDPDADGDGLAEEVSVALPLDPAEPGRFLRVRVSER